MSTDYLGIGKLSLRELDRLDRWLGRPPRTLYGSEAISWLAREALERSWRWIRRHVLRRPLRWREPWPPARGRGHVVVEPPPPATLQDAIALQLDETLYGTSYRDVMGRRVDPAEIRVTPLGRALGPPDEDGHVHVDLSKFGRIG